VELGMKQADFLHIVETDSIKIQTSREGGIYRAYIANGWWIATGRTRQRAVANVIKAYNRETDHFQQREEIDR
jgi:hypothetical protein